ncbi:unnamed protein product, partial [Rotaria socialis]
HCQHVSSNEVLNHPEAFMLFYAKVCPTSIPMNESFQQIPQTLMPSTPENNIVLNSPFLNSSVPAHSTPINTSITLLNEQLSRNNSLIDMMTMIPFEDGWALFS